MLGLEDFRMFMICFIFCKIFRVWKFLNKEIMSLRSPPADVSDVFSCEAVVLLLAQEIVDFVLSVSGKSADLRGDCVACCET